MRYRAPGNGKRLNVPDLLKGLRDWSGHNFAIASPRYFRKHTRMNNTPSSLQRGVSTIQPGEPTCIVMSSATPRLPSASSLL